MTQPINIITHCTRCGNEFDEEQFDNPRLDKDDNEPICDDCYRELFESNCPLCEDLFDTPRRWEPGQYIYAPFGVDTPGIYLVNEWPFYGGPLLGGVSYFDEALTLVKPLEKANIEEGNFICPDCIRKHGLLLSTPSSALSE